VIAVAARDGGVDINLNAIAERILGLPRDPGR